MTALMESGDASYMVLGGGDGTNQTQSEGLIFIPPNVDGLVTASNVNIHSGQVYQHYDGSFYTILAVAEHTSSKETIIVYKHTFLKHGTTVYAMPFEDFIGTVEPHHAQKFTLIFDPEDEEGTKWNLKTLVDHLDAAQMASVTLVP